MIKLIIITILLTEYLSVQYGHFQNVILQLLISVKLIDFMTFFREIKESLHNHHCQSDTPTVVTKHHPCPILLNISHEKLLFFLCMVFFFRLGWTAI